MAAIAEYIGIDTIDRLADAWRWWAAIGSFVGLILLHRRFMRLFCAWVWGRLEHEERTILSPAARLLTTFCAALFMIGAFIGGLIIPLVHDGRIIGIESLEFRGAIAFVWLMFGSAAWGIAISLAPRSREILAAAFVLWWAAYVAVENMVKAAL